MANVQFEEENQFSSGGSFQSRRILGMPATPGMVRFLGKIGIRDEKVAGYILITVALAAAILAVVIFARELGGNRGSQPTPVSPDKNLPSIDPGRLF